MHHWDEFKRLYPPERWLIREPSWDPKLQQTRETQFTQGNGYFCCRGVLEEIPYDATPGTFLAGLFDRTGAQITELVNCPNPINIRIDAYGEKVGMVAMDHLRHERVLDMRDGVLNRQTMFKTTHKKRVLYQSRRFISMHNKHLGVIEVHITPMDVAMTFNVQTTVDFSVSNKGVLTEGRKIHYVPHEVSTMADLTYLCVRTFENQTLIGYATSLEICRHNRCRLVADRVLKLRVRKGETITFRKFFIIYTSRRVKPHQLKRQCIGALKKARRAGLKRLFEEHQRAWQKRWRNANIDIEGDESADQALRFNLYHLILAGNEESDVSVGARTLSGEGYRGHIFWDAEIFVIPFFIHTFPQIARNQLMYRVNRLNAARSIAAAKGYRGALFPWESADTGEECTPSWAKAFDGTIIRITTLDYEHHIVADIAFAVDRYVRATNDYAFILRHGFPILAETARFWADRVQYSRKRKRYEIHSITGPDEFHEDIKNNAFTNTMARWNLEAAASWHQWIKQAYPKRLPTLMRQLNLTEKEITSWQRVASKIYIPLSRKRKLIEQFEGYFKLRDPHITQLDKNFMPVLPASVDWHNVKETQLVKQADVVMLFHLFPDRFNAEEKKRNYYHYERRTLHKSSLSPAIHASVGLEVGDNDKALHYFAHSLATDLSDIHANTFEGIHAASAGGTWQTTIMGFAGMRVHDDHLSFTPHLPEHWRGMKFAVWFKGARLRISINHQHTCIAIEKQKSRKKLVAAVYGEIKLLKKGRFTTFDSPQRR